ncbi:MarR family winged helix-turn-helix transcriptional regulator [Schlegelella sp. S2-27]|uniref:MarR family winged helix-turn-helix transcriptional regulator n=1 Tax=Caldimonas mangrovi TaxID=2944811 RepID=A0ABT0YIX9_9BURK|nr:MarR family winged helix-turn-helix transcriptional regulator [Caldimonas mangrovi]MCM5678686.1 MarR family winged helix-turn-helix transcriptional regulator [Caldimonas mangrovi]
MGIMPASAAPRLLRLETSLLYQFSVISNRVGGTVHALCRERFGVSAAAWRVMAHLGELQPVTAKEIAKRSAMDSVNLSRALNLLDELGYVERRIDPSDRRRIILHLTATGQAVYDEVVPYTIAAEQRLLSELGAAERATLRKLMKRVWERSAAMHDADGDAETPQD